MRGDGVKRALYWVTVALLLMLIGLLTAQVWAAPALRPTRGEAWAKAETLDGRGPFGNWNRAWETDDEQVA